MDIRKESMAKICSFDYVEARKAYKELSKMKENLLDKSVEVVKATVNFIAVIDEMKGILEKYSGDVIDGI